jgi:integrase
VDRSTIAHIMAKADNRWKVIIGLCRYAGLRNPSETLSLKWSHIEGREIRECPIFPDVLKILEYAYELYLSRDNPSEYVCDADSYRAAAQTAEGWKNSNLRTQFLKLLKKAGVEPWPRVFHSMRASLQTEFEENSLGTSFVVGWAIPKKWPKHTICLSLPNTSKRPPSLR